MASVQIKGFVYEMRFSWETTGTFVLFNSDTHGDSVYTLVGPASFSYEVPKDYNPTASKLAALAAKREEACKAFADTVREIDLQISKLQAIEFDGVTA